MVELGARPAATCPSAAAAADGQVADPAAHAREICLRQLATRARSRAELAAALRRRGVTDEIADAVLDRLVAVGLVDDSAFAAAYVASARVHRGLGRRALAAELHRRGVDPDTVEAATAVVEAQDEEQSARELVQRRLRSMERLTDQTRTRRLVAMLTRKGYPVDLAVRIVYEQLGRGPDDDAMAPLVEDIEDDN